MANRSFRMTFADLNRLRKILIVVFESGGGLLVDRLRLKYLVPQGQRTLFGVSLSHLGITLFAVLLVWFVIRLKQGPPA